jgi:hypothetical protein
LKNYFSQVTRLKKNKKIRARRAEQNRYGERPLKALQSLLFATEQFVFLFQSFIVPNALEIKSLNCAGLFVDTGKTMTLAIIFRYCKKHTSLQMSEH